MTRTPHTRPIRRLPWRIRAARWLVGWHIPRTHHQTRTFP